MRLVAQMLYEHLNSHLQPWFEADVQALLAEPDIAAVRAGKYVSMHIRRTDKQIFDRDPFTETEVHNRTYCCNMHSPTPFTCYRHPRTPFTKYSSMVSQ